MSGAGPLCTDAMKSQHLLKIEKVSMKNRKNEQQCGVQYIVRLRPMAILLLLILFCPIIKLRLGL